MRAAPSGMMWGSPALAWGPPHGAPEGDSHEIFTFGRVHPYFVITSMRVARTPSAWSVR
jgi:hypothetical protein